MRIEPQLSAIPPSVPLLAAERVEKRYGAFRPVLTGVDFALARGEFLVVEGPAGCGKSVLLRLLAGLEPASGGRILIAGEDLARMRPRARAHLRCSLGILPPGGGLLDGRGPVENVALAAWVAGSAREEGWRRARAALERVGIDVQRLGQLSCAELGAGARQCVALARALVNRPALLLLDDLLEPLDETEAARLIGVLAQFSGAGVAVIASARRGTEAGAWPAGARRLRLAGTGART